MQKSLCSFQDIDHEPVQVLARSPTDCGALCLIKKHQEWGGHGLRWAAAP